MVISGVMFGQTFAHFPGQIQAGKFGIFLFQLLDDTEAVVVVFEAAMAASSSAFEHRFAFVAKGRMAEVVRQGDGFGEIVIQPQGAGDVARDGGHFDGVREPRAQMVAGAVEENLRLVFQPAKGARMDDAIAVALIMGAP